MRSNIDPGSLVSVVLVVENNVPPTLRVTQSPPPIKYKKAHINRISIIFFVDFVRYVKNTKEIPLPLQYPYNVMGAIDL
jgi:hypothetical protein